MCFNASPTVVQAVAAARNRDPCGDTLSIPNAIAADNVGLRTIAVPLLLLAGRNDALFPPAGVDQQKGMFTGSGDVTEVLMDKTGHAITLERTAAAVRDAIAAWLSKRGF